MIKKIILATILVGSTYTFGQSYAPAVGQPGSTAIHKDSSVFVAWATGVSVKHGYLNALDTTFLINGSNKASFGVPENALYAPEGNTNAIVSLGDGGEAILTFDQPIQNGNGFDFAVFENSFSDDFLELAFVEVSSDGQNFFRFPAHSELSTSTQIGGFSPIDCRYIHNFAGKYRQGFGTPFDLDDINDDPLLDKNAITHVKILDVIGSINSSIATKDSYGNTVNDPFPTPFESCGFDLDAVGVIHQKPLKVDLAISIGRIFPNPAYDQLTIAVDQNVRVSIISSLGMNIYNSEIQSNTTIDVEGFAPGLYSVILESQHGVSVQKISIR